MSVPKDPPAQNSLDLQSVAPPSDPDHWLFRLTADQWLQAADNELLGATRALTAKQQRAGVTHARRAAGMALNACLCVAFDEAYGRSYMDHLNALQKDDAVSAEVREAATRLLAQPLTQKLVTLGPKGDVKPAELAGRIIEYARQRVLRSASPATG